MRRFEITAPATGFTGVSAGVAFANGKATVEVTTPELRRAVQYFRSQGYTVVDLDAKAEAEAEQQDPVKPVEDPPARPAGKSASKAEWVAYALYKGMAEADANAMSRDQLADHYPQEG